MGQTKILLPAFDFKPALGGVANYGHELAQAFSRIPGVEVKVIAREDSANGPAVAEYDSAAPFPVHRYKAPEKAVLALPFWAYAIGSHLTSWKPDLIYCPLWFPDGAAAYIAQTTTRSKIPYALAVHGMEVSPAPWSPALQARRAILSPLMKETFRHSRKIFAVSEYTRNLVLQNVPIDSSLTAIANNGVNLDTFSQRASDSGLREKYNLHGHKLLLTVTRLHAFKGIDKVIESLTMVIDKIPNLKYLVVGTGPDLPRLQKLVQKRNLQKHVEFLGVLPQNDIVDLYNLADLFILMSREEPPAVEGFGLVFLEAAACGLPSIGGASGGIPDAIDNGRSGWLVSPVNLVAIAEKINSVLTDDDLRHQASNHCLEMVKSRTWDSTAKRILEVALG